jgi:hypothetical protein
VSFDLGPRSAIRPATPTIARGNQFPPLRARLIAIADRGGTGIPGHVSSQSPAAIVLTSTRRG